MFGKNINQFHWFDVLGDAANITTASIVLLSIPWLVGIWEEMCHSICQKANDDVLLDFGRMFYASHLIFSTILPGHVP
jgi:hypothetical protein